MYYQKLHLTWIFLLIFSLFTITLQLGECKVVPFPETPTYFEVNILDIYTKENIPNSYIVIEIEKIYLGKKYYSKYRISLFSFPQKISFPLNYVSLVKITAHAEGYKPSEPFIYTIPENPPKEGLLFEHTFYLEPLPERELKILVTDNTSKPLSKAYIELFCEAENKTYKGYTNEKGIFSLSTRFETSRIKVVKWGYEVYKRRIKIPYNQTEFKIALSPLERIVKKVVFEVKDAETKEPIEGVKISYISDYGVISGVTNKSGIAILENIPDVRQIVRVEKEGYVKLEFWTKAPEVDHISLELTKEIEKGTEKEKTPFEIWIWLVAIAIAAVAYGYRKRS